MNNPSEDNPFHMLASRLRTKSHQSGSNTINCDQVSSERHIEPAGRRLQGNMIALNREAQLPKADFNRTSCELRVASTSLRKSISRKKSSRLTYGILGYSYGMQEPNKYKFFIFKIIIMSNSRLPDKRSRRLRYRDLFLAMSRPGSAVKRMMLSDKLCLGSVPGTIGCGYDQLTDDTLTKRSNDRSTWRGPDSPK